MQITTKNNFLNQSAVVSLFMADQDNENNDEISASIPHEADKPFVPPIPEYPNLRPKPFTGKGGNNPTPPAHLRSRKGSRNRKTIIKELLDLAASAKWREQHKEFGWEYDPQQLEDQVWAAAVLKALGGDMAAVQYVLDSKYGKIPQMGEPDKPEKSHDEILRELIEPKKQIEGEVAGERQEED